MIVTGTDANDTLRVDFAGGNPVPDGLSFDGGALTSKRVATLIRGRRVR